MANQVDNAVIDAAMEYAGYGWRVVPCSLSKKHPELREWQRHATTDEGQITQWWTNGFAGAGVSLVFGPSSGIIDIDVDSVDDGESLRELAFGGEWPVTPTFLSGNKKTPHRLFRWRDDLPDLANVNLRGHCGLDIDLKLGAADRGSHSLAPPSGEYRWLPGLSPSECEVADLPVTFMTWLSDIVMLNGEAAPSRRTADDWDSLTIAVKSGSRNESIAAVIGGMLQNAIDVTSKESVSLMAGQARAVGASYSPPLSDEEVNRTFLSILKRERSKRAAADFDTIATSPDRAVEGPENTKPASPFTLEILRTEPPTYLLYADVFKEAEHSRIELTAEQLVSWRAVRVQAVKQANRYLPGNKKFVDKWEAGDGICAGLMESAERVEAEPERQRSAVVAELIMSQLAAARPVPPDDSGNYVVDKRGHPQKTPNGDVVFKFTKIVDELSYTSDKPSRDEIAKALKRAGVEIYRPQVSGERLRFQRLTPDGLRRLSEAQFGAPSTTYREEKLKTG